MAVVLVVLAAAVAVAKLTVIITVILTAIIIAEPIKLRRKWVKWKGCKFAVTLLIFLEN